MEAVNVNIRVDKEDKKAFSDFCTNVGLSVTSAINLFIKRTINDGKIPFEIKESKPTDSLLKAINEVAEIEANPEKATTYSSFKELCDANGISYA